MVKGFLKSTFCDWLWYHCWLYLVVRLDVGRVQMNETKWKSLEMQIQNIIYIVLYFWIFSPWMVMSALLSRKFDASIL